ncbi:MAG: asparagine synthase (glutamine-hydrolyzing) [Oligoflexia bacterium]|nr:asparagine synthase (glutamine-hydrolyzing) [Oligoflexia bacterium]
MCGISGIINSNAITPNDCENMESMLAILKHRGPDFSQSVKIGDHTLLGHNRLSIIDLDDRSHQPMKDSSGKLWIVFNGEIYNYKQIKNELTELGYYFRTSSDTEVILLAYREWGLESVQLFNGMFSIAIFDQDQEQLVLMRDRIGKKPLYYCMMGERFIFSSELKGILQCGISDTIDFDALNFFLSFGYISGQQSIFTKVKKLLPGHYLVLDLKAAKHRKEWSPQITQYWNLSSMLAGKISKNIDYQETMDVFEGLIEDSVKLRLCSDVPIGSFLSGGIDSSLVSFYASRHLSKLKTYSIGFNHERLNELAYAKQVANRLSTDHTEFIVDIEETKSIMDDAFFAYDEPFADTSMIPTLWVSKLARKEVTVALTGDGGDELFGGYSNYYFRRHSFGEMIPRVLRPMIRSLSMIIPENTKGKYFLYGLGEGKKGSFVNTHNLFRPMERGSYLQKRHFFDKQSVCLPEEYYKSFMGLEDNLLNFTHADIKIYLCDDLLVKVDRASMANSLETRSPLLDFRIIELALGGLEKEHKCVGKSKKYLLKQLARKNLGEDYYQANNHRKHGFGIQDLLQQWFEKGGWLANDYQEIVTSTDDEYISKQESLKLLKKFQKSYVLDKYMASRKLFTLYAYFKWKNIWGRGVHAS